MTYQLFSLRMECHASRYFVMLKCRESLRFFSSLGTALNTYNMLGPNYVGANEKYCATQLGYCTCCAYCAYCAYCTNNISAKIGYVRAGSGWTPQILSATNAACNIYSNATYFVSCWPPRTAGEGDTASFSVGDPINRVGASGEDESRLTTSLQNCQ